MDSSEIISSALSLSRSYSTPYKTTLGGGATIPPLPKVVEEISIDYDKSISSLQVLAAGIHETVGLDLLKFISSAVITLSGVVSNPTGSATHPTEKLVSRVSESGEETLVFTDSSDGPYIEYNGYRIKRESIRPFHDADAIEVAAYIGNAVHALGKGLGNENFSAFLDNRFKTVEARLTTQRSIFVPNSQFVTRDFVKKCNMASVAFPHIVANLIHWICKRARNFGSAPSQAFANFVQLLEGHGLTNLTIIHEGIRVAPWLLQDIPELIGDLPAYIRAMEILQASDPDTQAYAKVIHQNRYVPIPADLKIAGAYWEVLKLLKSTISKFQGVDIGDGMRIRVATAIKEHHFMEEPKFS